MHTLSNLGSSMAPFTWGLSILLMVDTRIPVLRAKSESVRPCFRIAALIVVRILKFISADFISAKVAASLLIISASESSFSGLCISAYNFFMISYLDQIKTKCEQRGIPVYQAFRMAKVNPSTYSRTIRNETSLRLKTAVEVSLAIDVLVKKRGKKTAGAYGLQIVSLK